jgi:hypothetical protein
MVEDFLINAELCDLRLGQTKTEVLNKLGAPEDHSDKKGKTEIWKYGGLEISFNQDSLSFTGLYFNDGSVPLPTTLSGTKVIEFSKTTTAEFEAFLRLKGLAFTVDKNLTFDDQMYLRVTKTKVGVCFVKGQLHSIQLAEQSEKNFEESHKGALARVIVRRG